MVCSACLFRVLRGMKKKVEVYAQGLDRRMTREEVRLYAYEVCHSCTCKQILFRLLFHENERISKNAAWIFTHFDTDSVQWLRSRQSVLVQALRTNMDSTRKRLFLTLIERQKEIDWSSDLLNFCLNSLSVAGQPDSIRVLSIKIASRLCASSPELMQELNGYIDMLKREPLAPSLACVLRKMKSRVRIS